MTPVVVLDASAAIALLVGTDSNATWVADVVRRADLMAPAHMPLEVAGVLRRDALRGLITQDAAAQAHADLLDLDVALWPYEVLAPTTWRLRENLSIADAAYVALAALVGAPLLTLDRRLANAPNLPCSVVTPPSTGA